MYVYVARSGPPSVLETPCLEMYISTQPYDKDIINKQQRIAYTLNRTITLDVYHTYTDDKTMLYFTTHVIQNEPTIQPTSSLDDVEEMFLFQE